MGANLSNLEIRGQVFTASTLFFHLIYVFWPVESKSNVCSRPENSR